MCDEIYSVNTIHSGISCILYFQLHGRKVQAASDRALITCDYFIFSLNTSYFLIIVNFAYLVVAEASV